MTVAAGALNKYDLNVRRRNSEQVGQDSSHVIDALSRGPDFDGSCLAGAAADVRDSTGTRDRAVHLERVTVLGSDGLVRRGHDLIDVSGVDGVGVARGLLRHIRIEVDLSKKGIACRPGDPGSQRRSGLDGMPFRVGDDTDKVVDPYNLRAAGQGVDDATVDILNAGSEGGRPDDSSVKHAGDTNVLHVLEGALGLGRDIDARDG